ncbi:MAG: ABC transporter substrate-binding protein [Spirochaetes bacterium]|nr:ABC transporter substrate-binding protein [Spirochaetota bacterium]
MKKSLVKLVLITTGIVSILLTISCSSKSKGPEEIAVIVKTSNSSFWQNVEKGAKDAEAELKSAGMNVMISFDGPEAETKVNEQVNLVENAINRGVKAIVLAPSDPDALKPVLQKAKDAKIPVIIIDSAIKDESLYTSFLATDNKLAGELCAKALLEKAGTEGKVAVMSYVAGVGSEIGRVGGFIDYIKANSKMKIVGPFYSQADMVTALNQTTDVLAANPDLKAIFGANEPTAVGMGRAIKEAGKSGKVVAIGFDGNEDLQNFVKDGTLVGIAAQSPYNMGYLGVKTAMDAANGKTVSKEVDTGVLFISKENIDSTEAKNVLY